MSLEINQQPEYEPLTEQEEQELNNKLNELWKLGEDAKADSMKRKERVRKAYDCQHEQIILKRNGSKAYLPWVYTAIESAHARLSSALMPKDEDVFVLSGETEDDQAGCDVMTEYIKSVCKDMDFPSKFDDGLKELLFGDVVFKVTWRRDEKQETQFIEGQPTQATVIDYNSFYAEPIPSKDFIIYPVSGDFARASCAHRVWRHKDELLAVQEQGFYRNVDLISDGDDKSHSTTKDDTDHQGLAVKEYWLHRIKIGDKVYKNMVATQVDDKHIIRFEPNKYDYGITPFVYCPLIKDYGKLTGHGLCDRAYEIQKQANFVINQVFDESKVKLFGFYKYVSDSAFNPASFVARPGGLVEVGDLNNLQPVNPNINQLSFGITELQFLQNEFETTTGVPKFLTGVRDQDSGKDTATAKRLAADGADTRFRSIGNRVNQNLVKPLFSMFYALTRQMAIQDPEVLKDIANRTQQRFVEMTDPMTGQKVKREFTPEELVAKLPNIPGLTKVDINVVGFENVLDKAEKAGQFERWMQSLISVSQMDSSIIKRVKGDQALEYYTRNLNIDSDLLRNDQEMAELGAEEAQQQQKAMTRKIELAGAAQRLGLDPKVLMAA